MNKITFIDPMIGTIGDERQPSSHGGGTIGFFLKARFISNTEKFSSVFS